MSTKRNGKSRLNFRHFCWHRTIVACAITTVFAACATPHPHSKKVWRRFAAPGVSRVVLRASNADQVEEINLPASSPPSVLILGLPKVKIGDNWEFDFGWQIMPFSHPEVDYVSRRYGSTLVISTKNEARYPDRECKVVTVQMWLSLPQNIHVIRENREITRDGKPNLSPP